MKPAEIIAALRVREDELGRQYDALRVSAASATGEKWHALKAEADRVHAMRHAACNARLYAEQAWGFGL